MKIHMQGSDLKEVLEPFEKLLKPSDELNIRCEKGKVHLYGKNGGTWLDMEPCNLSSDSDCVCSVCFGQFRLAVNKANSNIEMEIKGNTMTIRAEGIRMVRLPVLSDKPELPVISPDSETTPLPTGFAGFLLQAFQSAATGNPSRPAIKGVNVSGKGVAATDGHQLVSIPLPTLRMEADVTMPPSPLYEALRKRRWASLSIWDDKSGKRHFAIQGDGFLLSMDAMEGLYPQYWTVLPDKSALDVKTVLSSDSRAAAIEFLSKALKPDGLTTEMWVFPDRLELSDRNDRMTSFSASTEGGNLPCGVFSNAKFILQALKLGHTTIQLNSAEPGVIVASGGSGLYAWMPFKDKPGPCTSTTCKSSETTTKATTTKKENPKMTQTSSSPVNDRPAALPEQPRANETTPSATPSDPLSDLSATIASMKENLDNLQARLIEAGRKLRKAAIHQKQKERTYQDTQKLIEKIRLAV